MRHAGETKGDLGRELLDEQPVIHRNAIPLVMIKLEITQPLRGMIRIPRRIRGHERDGLVRLPRKAGRAAPRWPRRFTCNASCSAKHTGMFLETHSLTMAARKNFTLTCLAHATLARYCMGAQVLHEAGVPDFREGDVASPLANGAADADR